MRTSIQLHVAMTAQHRRGHGIDGMLCQSPEAVSKSSTTSSASPPHARPPNTYTLPPDATAALAPNARRVGIGVNASQVLVAGSKRSMSATGSERPIPPTTYTLPLEAT